MAAKSKPKNASRSKAKAAKPTEAKTLKSADSAPAAAKAAPKTATVKTTAKAAKKGKAKGGKTAGGAPAAKQSKTTAAAAEKQAENHVEHPVETFYVCTGLVPVEIRDTPPPSGTRSVEFASFATARDHFLDELIEAIEQYERVLHGVRGASSFADYIELRG
ncbi:MAG TPA: hypothetical protein VGG30_08395 [Pirellulales bacterium]|jgi:hypothetical protein